MKKLLLPILVIALAFAMPTNSKIANKIALKNAKRLTTVDIGTFNCSAGNFEAYGDPTVHNVTMVVNNDTGCQASQPSGKWTVVTSQQGTIDVYFTPCGYSTYYHYTGNYYR